MSDRRATVLAAFERHGDFSVDDDVVRVDTSPFDAVVEIAPRDDEVAYTLRIELPSLDTVVVGEDVPDVVVDGWAETLERRLRETSGLTSDLDSLDTEIDRTPRSVDVRMRFVRPADASAPAETVLALANYVDGTYLQGVIPGYDYGPPVDEMLSRARRRADDGTPGPADEPDIEPPDHLDE